MAKVFGTITPSGGTGTKTINLGVTGITRVNVTSVYPGASYIANCKGAWVSGTQKYITETEGLASFVPQNEFELVNNVGVVLYRASCTGISGSNLSWNVTIASITPTLLLDGDSF